MLIIPPLLNPKCFHTNFKLIVNILYFTNFGNKETKIKTKASFMNTILCCALREHLPSSDMC